MRFLKFGFAAAIGAVAFAFASTAYADAGADFARVLKDYQAAEERLRPPRDRADYLDRNGEELAPAYLALRRKITDAALAELAHVDRSGLSNEDRLSYDIFDWSLKD